MFRRVQVGVLVLCGTAAGCLSDAEVERCGVDASCLDANSGNRALASDDVQQTDESGAVCSASNTYLGYTFARYDGIGEHYSTRIFGDEYQRLGGGKAVQSCTSLLPECGDAGVDVAELKAAFANPDVVAAFAEAGANLELVFGVQASTALDRDRGLVMVIDNPSLYKRFGVGATCTGSADCRAIPPGITALVALLEQLDHEQSLAGPCAGFLEDGEVDTPREGGDIESGHDTQ